MAMSERYDEALYLKCNPDVARSVANGRFLSGFEHYVSLGRKEDRKGMPSDAAFAAEQHLNHEAPPAPLRQRVHGDSVLLYFIAAGQVIAGDIVRALPRDLRLTRESVSLDFGCGCGRVVSFLKKSLPGSFFATDIDKEAISWCQVHMSELARFSSNDAWPPLRFQTGYFDFIYSISIFTHLPEDMQIAWLQELSRVMKPGGHAFLTVQGEWLFPAGHLPQSEVDRFSETGFYYHPGELTDGLPEFYRTTFHSENYIRTRWADFFDIENIVRRGINNHQDIVICRKRK
jgi:SAM-dependent methyltransferase